VTVNARKVTLFKRIVIMHDGSDPYFGHWEEVDPNDPTSLEAAAVEALRGDIFEFDVLFKDGSQAKRLVPTRSIQFVDVERRETLDEGSAVDPYDPAVETAGGGEGEPLQESPQVHTRAVEPDLATDQQPRTVG
jgi:hypothetical protein